MIFIRLKGLSRREVKVYTPMPTTIPKNTFSRFMNVIL
jgi:hypothetical protein